MERPPENGIWPRGCPAILRGLLCWSKPGKGSVRSFNGKSIYCGADSCYNLGMAQKRPAEIERAQTLTHYRISGELFARIKYGGECFGWRAATAPCHDCGAT